MMWVLLSSLVPVSSKQKWWESLTVSQQKEYLKLHPKSKLKITSRTSKAKKPLSKNIYPEITALAKKVIKDSGYTPDQLASSGRCYEFRDSLAKVLKDKGFKGVVSTDNFEWIRGKHKKCGLTMNYVEENMLGDQDNDHAWVCYKGIIYDALNPEGVKGGPFNMRFYAKLKKNKFYYPDEEKRWAETERGRVWDQNNLLFVKSDKKGIDKERNILKKMGGF